VIFSPRSSCPQIPIFQAGPPANRERKGPARARFRCRTRRRRGSDTRGCLRTKPCGESAGQNHWLRVHWWIRRKRSRSSCFRSSNHGSDHTKGQFSWASQRLRHLRKFRRTRGQSRNWKNGVEYGSNPTHSAESPGPATPEYPKPYQSSKSESAEPLSTGGQVCPNNRKTSLPPYRLLLESL